MSAPFSLRDVAVALDVNWHDAKGRRRWSPVLAPNARGSVHAPAAELLVAVSGQRLAGDHALVAHLADCCTKRTQVLTRIQVAGLIEPTTRALYVAGMSMGPDDLRILLGSVVPPECFPLSAAESLFQLSGRAIPARPNLREV